MSIPSTGAGRTAPRSPAVSLTATLALLSFVVPLATDMYLPAFPRMADELGTDASGVQLTLTSFLFGMAAGQLVLGPLSDRYGRRMPILVGTLVCTLATALCAMAPGLAVLIALRFFTGFAGAAGVVVGRAVVSDVATGTVAARLFGVLMALGGIAPIIAPLAGGAVVNDAGGWRGVFWVLTGVSLLMFRTALAFVPESLPEDRRRPGGTASTSRAGRLTASHSASECPRGRPLHIRAAVFFTIRLADRPLPRPAGRRAHPPHRTAPGARPRSGSRPPHRRPFPTYTLLGTLVIGGNTVPDATGARFVAKFPAARREGPAGAFTAGWRG